VRQIELSDPMIDYIVDIIRATRSHPSLMSGASPRACNMLATAARAYAALHGRAYVIPDDVQALIGPAIAHRLMLSPAAEIDGETGVQILTRIVQETPAPR
jgi:MoxR-like ATPase